MFGNLRRSVSRSARSRRELHCRLRLESLEDRAVPAATVAPTPPVGAPVAAQYSAADQAALNQILQLDAVAIQQAELATQRASTAGIRRFAQDALFSDVQDLQQILPLAAQAGVPNGTLTPLTQQLLGALPAASSSNFGQQFTNLALQESAYQVTLLNGEVQTAVGTTIQSAAQLALPTLESQFQVESAIIAADLATANGTNFLSTLESQGIFPSTGAGIAPLGLTPTALTSLNSGISAPNTGVALSNPVIGQTTGTVGSVGSQGMGSNGSNNLTNSTAPPPNTTPLTTVSSAPGIQNSPGVFGPSPATSTMGPAPYTGLYTPQPAAYDYTGIPGVTG